MRGTCDFYHLISVSLVNMSKKLISSSEFSIKICIVGKSPFQNSLLPSLQEGKEEGTFTNLLVRLEDKSFSVGIWSLPNQSKSKRIVCYPGCNLFVICLDLQDENFTAEKEKIIEVIEKWKNEFRNFLRQEPVCYLLVNTPSRL